MNISIIGAGYVGLVIGTCLARLGLNVLCMDHNKVKFAKLLKGVLPIYGTVPVGTVRLVKEEILHVLGKLHKELNFDAASNPEFLREGSAVMDFMQPERIVAGCENDKVCDNVKITYPFLNAQYCENAYTACEASDCIVLATEWPQFGELDFLKIYSLVKSPTLIDLRNLYTPAL